MTEEESKITDEHRATIDQEIDSGEVTVLDDDVKRLRRVLEDDDPRWAEGTGIAPPYILSLLEQEARLMSAMPRVLPRGLLTNQEWRIERPLRIGETFRRVSRVVDIRERMGGRFGHSVLVTMQTDFLDESGERAASTMRTATQYDPERGQQ